MSSQQNLFSEDELQGPPDPGRSLAVHAKPARRFDKKQRAFNRLLARVDALRAEREAQKRHQEEALVFHAAHLAPRAQQALQLRTQVVRALRPFLHERRLSAADRRILRDVLAKQVDAILEHEEAPAPDLRELFEQLHGISMEDAAQGEIEAVRAEMEEFFGGLGLDVDAPDLRVGMTDEELAASATSFVEQMQRGLDDAAAREQARGRRKTRRELREEEQARRIEEARRNSIGAVYRRLAKALHPDLERDPEERQRKSALMQRVTAAHADNDLHTLLRLEVEIVHGDAGDVTALAAETLDAYTQMLEQQVAELEAEELELLLHPRYQAIVAMGPFGPLGMIDVHAEVHRLDAEIDDLRGSLDLLSAPNALREVKALVRLERDVRRRYTPPWIGTPPPSPGRKARARSKRRPGRAPHPRR